MSQQKEHIQVRLVTAPISEVTLDQLEDYLPITGVVGVDRVIDSIIVFTVSQHVLGKILQESRRRFARRRYDLTHLVRTEDRLSRSPPTRKILD